ncbi:MAG: ATP-binding protein [Acidobacteriota bacterium]|nr:ATP-binding protein [Acidobacteriota bacterium]
MPRQKTILLIEDNPDLRAATGDALKSLGYEVIVTAGSAPALEIARDTSFDLVLVNAYPARGRGIETLDRVRQLAPDFNRPAAKRQEEDGVILRVVDTGTGIPDKVRHKIFEPFFSTKKETHSGLGLATVLGVVEQNRGRVAVDSGESGADPTPTES